MNIAPHPIKEFNEEEEPQNRKCLLCHHKPPEDLKTADMTWRNRGWYSNAILNTQTRVVARFYLCPKHRLRTNEAWEWATGGDWGNSTIRGEGNGLSSG